MKRRLGPDHHAVVVGGTSGIGRAIALRLASVGCAVSVIDRVAAPPDGESATCDRIRLDGGRASFHRCDVADPENVERAFTGIIDTYPAIHVLVNCVGIGQRAPLSACSDALVRRIVDVNLLGTVWTCRAALPHMPPDSVILNVSSGQAFVGLGYNSMYAATKAAIVRLSESLDRELRSRRVRVRTLVPDATQTPFTVLTSRWDPSVASKTPAAAGTGELPSFPSSPTSSAPRERTQNAEDVADHAFRALQGSAPITFTTTRLRWSALANLVAPRLLDRRLQSITEWIEREMTSIAASDRDTHP